MKLRIALVCVVVVLGTRLTWADTLQFQDYLFHDSTPDINCDLAHLKIPQGWGVKSAVGWNLAVMMPAKWYICAANLNGPELWVQYPGQGFIWRNNFNLLGLNFQLHTGDADPAYGDEIEPPLTSATECIKQVIVPRFRKEIAQATVVSSEEFTAEQAAAVANAEVPDVMQQSRQIPITPKAARIQYEYGLDGRTVQEEFRLLVLFFDLQSGNTVVHVWVIPYCTSIRAEKGGLNAAKKMLANPIENSLKLDPAWLAKRDQVVTQAQQVYGQRLRDLAAAVESDIIANLNRSIFNMCQQSFQRRMKLEQEQFRNIDDAINGQTEYVTPSGQVIQAPLAPVGQSAWVDQAGSVHFFPSGENPNGDGGGTYQPLTQQ